MSLVGEVIAKFAGLNVREITDVAKGEGACEMAANATGQQCWESGRRHRAMQDAANGSGRSCQLLILWILT